MDNNSNNCQAPFQSYGTGQPMFFNQQQYPGYWPANFNQVPTAGYNNNIPNSYHQGLMMASMMPPSPGMYIYMIPAAAMPPPSNPYFMPQTHQPDPVLHNFFPSSNHQPEAQFNSYFGQQPVNFNRETVNPDATNFTPTSSSEASSSTFDAAGFPMSVQNQTASSDCNLAASSSTTNEAEDSKPNRDSPEVEIILEINNKSKTAEFNVEKAKKDNIVNTSPKTTNQIPTPELSSTSEASADLPINKKVRVERIEAKIKISSSGLVKNRIGVISTARKPEKGNK